jgi:hypothetical protein
LELPASFFDPPQAVSLSLVFQDSLDRLRLRRCDDRDGHRTVNAMPRSFITEHQARYRVQWTHCREHPVLAARSESSCHLKYSSPEPPENLSSDRSFPVAKSAGAAHGSRNAKFLPPSATLDARKLGTRLPCALKRFPNQEASSMGPGVRRKCASPAASERVCVE